MTGAVVTGKCGYKQSGPNRAGALAPSTQQCVHLGVNCPTKFEQIANASASQFLYKLSVLLFVLEARVIFSEQVSQYFFGNCILFLCIAAELIAEGTPMVWNVRFISESLRIDAAASFWGFIGTSGYYVSISVDQCGANLPR
jgi:hypothetical protein